MEARKQFKLAWHNVRCRIKDHCAKNGSIYHKALIAHQARRDFEWHKNNAGLARRLEIKKLFG